ncbi:MAG: TetR/AcrR family transcriptional regulator [Bacillaceae bacterium]|nr:TetR/AcrR family transcriptional regulator [Bacillaceae bacterium]
MDNFQIHFGHITHPTQQKILQSAVKIFSQKGFSGSTTREIAREAGVSEATIFRYFETKKDLLLALISPSMVKSITDLFVDMDGESEENVLKNFLKRNAEAIKDNQDLLKIILYEALFHPEIKEIIFKEIVQKKTRLLESYFEQQKRDGQFKDIDSKTATQTLIGMLIGFQLFKYAFPSQDTNPKQENDILDDIIRIFLYGMKK